MKNILPLLLILSGAAQADADRLDAVLAELPDEMKARYEHRHPKETLEFFGVEPGMTVAEGLPGRGWYSKVLLRYLGEDGHLIGIDYAMDMWPLFPFGTEEFIAERSTWTEDWPEMAAEWGGDSGASISAYRFGSVPDELAGTVDVVFFPRVLHNLTRFEDKGQYLTIALSDAFKVLKPGGTFGVVQHHARDDMPPEFADGSHGYLYKQFVIDQAVAAGFEYVAESEINANDKDQPSPDDIVWRLPPSLGTSRDDPELRAKLEAVGESNRMTLRFRKPE